MAHVLFVDRARIFQGKIVLKRPPDDPRSSFVAPGKRPEKQPKNP